MARVGVYDQIKAAFQDLVAPAIHELRGEIRVLDERVTALDQSLGQRIISLDEKLGERIISLDEKLGQRIASFDEKFGQRITGLDEKFDHKITMVDVKLDSSRVEMTSMKNELISEIRRLDARMDGVDRELHAAIDIQIGRASCRERV